jgi:hypothetical protein
MALAKKKVKRVRSSNVAKKLFATKMLGPEPDFKDKTPGKVELIKAYSWYSYFHDFDDAKGFIADYLKSIKYNKKTIRLINQLKDQKFRNIGWNCRILTLGGILPKDYVERIIKAIDTETLKLTEIKEEKVKSKPVISIQQRMRDKVSDLCGEINEEIDNFTTTGNDYPKMDEWMRNHDVKPAIAEKIAEKYRPLYAEVYEAYHAVPRGENSDLAFAYRHFKKKTLKRYMEFIKSIVAACEMQTTVAKLVKVPRKKKVKPATVLVEKVQYRDSDERYSLKSVNPKDIIGAKQLWVFNSKTRFLGVFNAMGSSGLSVKGTTIINFDPKTSITKKLRKPEVPLEQVVKGGKIILRRLMGEIKAKEKALKGRINKDTILVRIL